MADATDRKILRLTRQLEAAQAERRRRVLKWYENHGMASTIERFGLTKQRIQQLVAKERGRLNKETER